jgi:hypothetical protein
MSDETHVKEWFRCRTCPATWVRSESLAAYDHLRDTRHGVECAVQVTTYRPLLDVLVGQSGVEAASEMGQS